MTPLAASRRVWTRYVAIGDSFTEGMSDPDPGLPNAYVGWADRLAHHLDTIAEHEHLPFGYANLAVRGRKLDDVVGPQLETAMTMQPDLVSMVGGGNDLLRPQVDLDGLAARLEDAVVRLRHSGADVLLATPTDTRDAGLFKPLRGRHAVHSANLFTIAQRHVEILGEVQHHLAARPRPARLDEAQVPRRHAGFGREFELTESAAHAPVAQQRTDGRGCGNGDHASDGTDVAYARPLPAA